MRRNVGESNRYNDIGKQFKEIWLALSERWSDVDVNVKIHNNQLKDPT